MIVQKLKCPRARSLRETLLKFLFYRIHAIPISIVLHPMNYIRGRYVSIK